MDPAPDPGEPRELSAFAPLGLGLFFSALLWALVTDLMPTDPRALGGTVRAPTEAYGRYLGAYLAFGGAAAAAFALGFVRLVGPARQRTFLDTWNRGSDPRWIVYGSALAFLVPALLRTWLLRGLPLTDDEGAYRFMAHVLASGRLWAESPPFPLFFDRPFLVNDGRWYAQYFVGWPALLAPFTRLGLGGFANGVLAAATVTPLFLALRRLADSAWARVGMVLFLASPMLAVTAATELSHTSCLAALAWLAYLALRSADADASPATFAGAAVAMGVAFFVRPLSALGVGLPFLVLIGVSLLRRARQAGGISLRPILRPAAAFILPALALAGLFFTVNHLQNGSPTRTAYTRYLEYSAENDYRFSLYSRAPLPGAKEMEWVSPRRSLAMAAAGLWRLNADLFGWPASLAFLAFAGFRGQRRYVWAAAGTYLLSHAAVGNVGIDAFAPMHYIELALPVLILTVLGVERSGRLLAGGASPGAAAETRGAALPIALVAGSAIVAAAFFVPWRWGAIQRMVDEIERPFELVESSVEVPAVVFTLDPFVAYCRHAPTRGWVHERPVNHPEFRVPVVWANHLSLEADRLLVERLFPGRRAYVLGWSQRCEPSLAALEALPAGSIPDAPVDFRETLEALRAAESRAP